jgi:hypothetical protein
MANDAPPVFDDRVIRLIVASLPKRVGPRRLELLPRVLREWSGTELRARLSREPAAVIRERAKRVKTVGERANSLLQALKAIDKSDVVEIATKMPRSGQALWPKMKGHHWRGVAEINSLIQRIKDENDFLRRLATSAPNAWKRGRGQPQNITAYLVMQDAAGIFRWITNKKASRALDRVSGEATGAFSQFAAAIWPVVFGSDDGLPSAMKNWAKYQKLEGNALIANMAVRHPTWGLFKDLDAQ